MFYENLQRACEKNGVKMTPVVIECGGASGSITGWKKGTIPNSEIVIKLATRLNVSTDYLLLGKEKSTILPINGDSKELLDCYEALDNRGKIIVKAAAYHELDRIEGRKPQANNKAIQFESILPQEEITYRSTPLFDMPVSAGSGVFLDSDDYKPTDFPVEVVPNEASFAVRVHGTSMEPRFENDDILFIKRQPYLNDGEIGIIRLNDNVYCKVYDKKGKQPFLVSLNKEYEPIPIEKHDEVQIFGKVVGCTKL